MRESDKSMRSGPPGPAQYQGALSHSSSLLLRSAPDLLTPTPSAVNAPSRRVHSALAVTGRGIDSVPYTPGLPAGLAVPFSTI